MAGLGSLYAAYQYRQMDCDWTTWNKTLDASYFKNKIVWITGSSSGIGASLAKYLSSLNVGVKLVLSARRENKLQQLKQEIIDNNNKNGISTSEIYILPLDLVNKQINYYEGKYQLILKKFGVSSIDILINNAGVSMRSTFIDFDINDGVDMLQINLISPIILTKIVLTDMVKDDKNGRFGHIVNIGSVASRLQPGYRSVYSTTKSGLLGFGNSLNEEITDLDGIAVTEILPGAVQTDVDISAKGKGGVGHNKRDQGIQNGMSSDRCAELICIAISNKLRESWPVKGILGIMYTCYYLPGIYGKYLRPKISGMLAIAAGYANKSKL